MWSQATGGVRPGPAPSAGRGPCGVVVSVVEARARLRAGRGASCRRDSMTAGTRPRPRGEAPTGGECRRRGSGESMRRTDVACHL
ncbi:hypothetical protein FM125_10075 [Micrococcus lylae]|uniref:Uncharacterized protein n=1 Tax=Micrococcus lylae TaxID=1273 RepID=A0A1R4JR74_9MICC|nr:hypothetical protein FM125_10075 [Micrococcus lylae]